MDDIIFNKINIFCIQIVVFVWFNRKDFELVNKFSTWSSAYQPFASMNEFALCFGTKLKPSGTLPNSISLSLIQSPQLAEAINVSISSRPR